MEKLRIVNGRVGLSIHDRMSIAQDMPSSFTFEGTELHTVKEYWATVVYARRYSPFVSSKKKIGLDAAEALITKTAEEYHARTPLDFGNIVIDVRLLKFEQTRSVIIMSNIPGINGLYADMREKLGVDIPVPPIYVTLYTQKDTQPIEATTADEMVKFREQLTPENCTYLKNLALYGEPSYH